jgi:hypothetical protein
MATLPSGVSVDREPQEIAPMKSVLKKFTAKTPGGREYIIVVLGEMVDVTDLSDTKRRYEPSPLVELRTSDGRAVRRVEKGVYDIVGNPDIRVTSDDPDAQ